MMIASLTMRFFLRHFSGFPGSVYFLRQRKGGIRMKNDLYQLPAEERDACQRLPLPLCIFQATGGSLRPLLISDGMCRLLDLPREELASQWSAGFEAAVHPEDRQTLLRTEAQPGQQTAAKCRIAGRDGVYRRLSIQGSVVCPREGVRLLYCQFLPAESPERETALKRENSRLTRILDNVPAGIAVFRIEDGVPKGVSVNRHMAQAVDLHGGSTEISSPEMLFDYIHPDDREECRRAFSHFLNTGAPLAGSMRLRLDGTGTYLWVHVKGNLVRRSAHTSVAYLSYTDVDAMKRSEKALLKSRRIYETAMRSAQLILWEYDIPAGRIVLSQDEITQADCQKFQIPQVIENVPDVLGDYFDQRDLPAVLEMYRQVLSGRDASCDAWYQTRPGQEPRCEHISYTVVRDGDGRPVRAYGLGRNITAEKKLADRYQQEMDYLRQNTDYNLIAKGHDSLTQNRVLEYTPLNDKAYAAKPGRTYDEACAAFLKVAYLESERQAVAAAIDRETLIRRYRQGQTYSAVEYRRAMNGRPPFWVSTVIHTYMMPASGDIEIFTYTYDITERKQNEAIMSRIAETEFDYIGVIDVPSRTFEFIRKGPKISYPVVRQRISYDHCCQYVRSHDVSTEEQPQFFLSTDLDVILEHLRNTPRYIATYKRTENGALICVQLAYSWLDRESGSILVVRTNVTPTYEREQRQLQEVEQAKLEAVRANEAKSAFLSSMSHDLRTPLNGILGFATLALRETDAARKQDYLTKIHSSGKLLESLVNDTLEMSRIESGKMTLEPEPVDGPELCAGVVTALKPAADLKRLHLHADAVEFPAAFIWADRLKLQKILLNLLSNAIKYTPPGGDIRLTVEPLNPPADGRTCRISVADNGIGIGQAFLPKLYEPFAQERRAESASVTGTGLGLSIVKRIVDLMGGVIAVETAVGQGSCFTVELPLPAASPAP